MLTCKLFVKLALRALAMHVGVGTLLRQISLLFIAML